MNRIQIDQVFILFFFKISSLDCIHIGYSKGSIYIFYATFLKVSSLFLGVFNVSSLLEISLFVFAIIVSI